LWGEMRVEMRTSVMLRMVLFLLRTVAP
jgi:hypothetical protein